MSSNTICVSQEGPANALALNKDCSQVVIAGRNVFKVFSIDNNEFNEVCNLRVGKNLNLNYSSIDVAWNPLEENTLATAATNGAVVVWNLGRSGRSKQEHVFSDHKRTVNKVSFHQMDPSLLISGSQDGMMKCFDLRMKEVARTFLSNTESVRDVQFSPHAQHTFAAVSENGNVQLWDVRRADRCVHQFTAHSGPVFACDWHPEVPWLATASRDKTIKVWDIHAKPSLEHTIYTIAAVGHVKWRPQKKYHIASCALVLDSSVNVWDVRRPHVPFATFGEHRDVTTAVAWAGNPDVFLSTSRDCTLYRHTFGDAQYPALNANPHGIAMSARGELLLATCRNATFPTFERKTSSSSHQLEAAFRSAAASNLTRWRCEVAADAGTSNHDGARDFAYLATTYRIKGAPLHQLCTHNSKAARDCNKLQVAQVWSIIGIMYAFKKPSVPALVQTAARLDGAALGRDDDHHYSTSTPQGIGCGGGVNMGKTQVGPGCGDMDSANNSGEVPFGYMYGAEDEAEVEDWPESQFNNNGVLGLPTLTIYIPSGEPPVDSQDEAKYWLTAASAHYVDMEAQDWTLPEEAFPLRADDTLDAAPAATCALQGQPASTTTAQHQSHQVVTEASVWSATALQSVDSASSGSAPSTTADSWTNNLANKILSDQPAPSVHSNAGITTVEDAPCGVLRAASGATRAAGAWEGAALLAAALRLHAELGDVQTAAVAMLALGEHRADLAPHLDDHTQEHWLLGYLELLARCKLWNVSTEVIRNAWLPSVWQLSQQSTTVHLSCGRCGRHLARPGHAPCDRCGNLPSVCSVCNEVVKGLYVWCQGCAHGGHALHLQAWLAKHKACPAGCGHLCEYG